jgi:hypothetical protein
MFKSEGNKLLCLFVYFFRENVFQFNQDLVVALLYIEAHGSCCCFDFRQYLFCRKPRRKPCLSLNRILSIAKIELENKNLMVIRDLIITNLKTMNIPFASQRVC